jgi:hypothetical protein
MIESEDAPEIDAVVHPDGEREALEGGFRRVGKRAWSHGML